MYKFVSVGLLAVMMSSCSVAYADTVYNAVEGQWSLTGYWDYNPDKPGSCVMSSTFETGPERGARINLNIFPRYDLSENLTLTIYHPRSYNMKRVGGNKYEVHNETARFENNGESYFVDFQWQWYTDNNNNTVIIREISDEFYDLWKVSEEVEFFPNTESAILVGLRGTQTMDDLVSECEQMVLGQLENE